MAQIKIQTLQQNLDQILQIVGNNAFINWQSFSQNSSEIVTSIDELNRNMSIFREIQHRNFIQAMKKLKSLDLPDLFSAVKNKKLPKEALRGVLSRFKTGQDGKIELTESIDSLKENATKTFNEYVDKNKVFVEQMKKFNDIIKQKIKDSGYVPEKIPEINIKATVKFDIKQDAASKLASDIKIENIPNTNLIGLKTYNQIVQKSFDLIKQEYQKLTVDARKQQREKKQQYPQYLKIMNEYLNNGEALIIEGQTLLAKKLGLPDKKLQESQLVMMERGLGNHMLMIQSQLRARVKQCLPATQDVSLEVAKEIIQYQTDMIGAQTETIKKIFEGLQKSQQTVQTIPMLLALILNDLVFEKYGYEEEDFMKNVSQQAISTNPELVKIFRDMQIAIIKLMQQIGVIPAEVGKMMEQSAAQRTNAAQGNVPQMVPGMMPGNNPMDMLQMQQMQQMQQMFANQQQQPK